MKFAIITFVITLSSIIVIAQPAEGRADDSQRRGERRRPAPSVPVTPDSSRSSSDMIATGNYTLRCRGGNGFVFREVDGRVHSTGYIITTLEISFSPSSQAAGAGLQPGECALIERAFSRDEIMQVRDPVKVRFETPANSQLKQSQHGSTVDSSSTAAESYPDAITIPVYFRSPDHYWTFNVTNPGQGYFLASSHAAYVSAVGGTKKSGGILKRNF